MNLVPVNPGYLLHKDKVTPREAAFLLCGYEPPATYEKAPLQRIADAEDWVIKNVPLEADAPEDSGMVVRCLPPTYVKMADLLLMVARAKLSNPLGAELLAAQGKEHPAFPAAEPPPLVSAKQQEREAALREYLRDNHPGEDWRALKAGKKELYRELQKRYPEVFNIGLSTFTDHFWKKQSVCTLVR
jgi:hypothetical protein